MNAKEIQIALNDIGASGGGDYTLKSGYYEVSGMIIIPSFTRLICQGNVRFIPTANIDILFFMKNTEWAGIFGGSILRSAGCKINRGAFIYGNASNNVIEGYSADGAGFGILVQATPDGIRPYNNRIIGNITRNCGNGCYIDGADKTKVADNNFCYSDDMGLLIGNSKIGTLSGNICDYNSGHGTYLSGCKEFSLIGEHNCKNKLAGLHIRFYGEPINPVKDENNTIIGGVFSFNGGNGIHFQEHVNHNTVEGAICRGNSAVGLRMHGEGCEYNKVSVIAYENINGQITNENSSNVVHNIEN